MQAVLTQIVAQELGVPTHRVSMNPIDTSRVPDCGPTVASRATTFSGLALKDACRKIKQRLVRRASRLLSVPESKIAITDGTVRAPGKSIPLDEVISACTEARDKLSAHGWHKVPELDWDPKTGLGNAYITYAYATNIAEVEVDTETGEIKVLRFISAHDVGKAINPKQVEGQIEGGIVQGMGYCLMEEIIHDERGRIVNPDLTTYLIPTAVDAPQIVPLMVESAFEMGPYGAKGFGEQPLMGVAPAITNAIRHAMGIRITELPAKPERIIQLLASTNNLTGKVER
jgi:CO/xanthine dehydrogenase Mo-binding subunit